ncbi:unnamed protein product, partial [Thlaspi arvense]
MKRCCFCKANEVRSRTLATLQQLRFFQTRVDARIIKTGFDTDTCRSNFVVEDLLRRGQVSAARKVYDEMPHKNTVSTNTMISGYVKSDDLSRARELFDAMVEGRTVVTWTILMGWYTGNNRFDEAFKLFREMCRSRTLPDHVTFATLLPGCNDAVPENAVGQVHAFAVKLGFDRNPFLTVCNVLVKSYCEVKRRDLACVVFEQITEKDSVTFNTLITGYEKDGLYIEAVRLFVEMRRSGHKPSDFTFSGVLKAVVGIHDFVLGQQLHGSAVSTGFWRDVAIGRQAHCQAIVAAADSIPHVGNSLVD